MSVGKAIYQLIHEHLDRENGKAPSPVPFIECSCEWAEQSSPALPQGTGTGCTSDMGECLSSLDGFLLKINRPSMRERPGLMPQKGLFLSLDCKKFRDTPQRAPWLCGESHKDLHSHCC